MKVRFDTYTKSREKALNAFDNLSHLTTNLSLNVSDYPTICYNLHGEVSTGDVEVLEHHCSDGWDDDSSNLQKGKTMPYIKEIDRRNFMWIESAIEDTPPATAGELQYLIAIMIHHFMREKGLNYQTCNDVMGALTGANMEFYRRFVADYEDSKIRDNGDVYYEVYE